MPAMIPTALSTDAFRKLKGEGTASPCWASRLSKLIVVLSSLAGVPVCSRPSRNPAERSESDRPVDGASFILPAGNRLRPNIGLLESFSGPGAKRFTNVYFP